MTKGVSAHVYFASFHPTLSFSNEKQISADDMLNDHKHCCLRFVLALMLISKDVTQVCLKSSTCNPEPKDRCAVVHLSL